MILAIGLPPARLTAIWALRIARVWIFTKSGNIRPRRQPRRPSIGFCSCSDLIVASSSLSSSLAPPVPPRPGDLDQLLLEVRQELVERRIEEADDDRQAVHRLEDALEVALLELLELGHRGVERSRPPPAPSAMSASPDAAFALARVACVRDEDRAAHDLEALALAEHVLGAAQADALRAVAPAWAASSGLSAFVQTPSGGCSSAQPRIVWSSGWSSKRASTVGSAPR